MISFIQAARKAVDDQNWYAALALALTLPDIAASLENADGKTSGKRFAAWFDKWMPAYSVGREKLVTGRRIEIPPFMKGADCYALRCAVLHNGTDDVEEQRARETLKKFDFTFGGEGVHVHRNRNGETLQLEVGPFVTEICDACEQWRENFLKNEPEAKKREAGLIVISDPRAGFSI
ncbi:hypothetical protein RAD16_05200 [Bradyrhizobium sp. 18BD]